jgi:hypothetical protein
MLETARRCSRAASPSGNCSTTSIRGCALAGHCSLSWTKLVCTCEGFNDVADFSRIQRAHAFIAGRSRDFARKTSCRGAHTAVRVDFRFRSHMRAESAMRSSVMPRPEALAHEALFRAFEIPPDSCRRVRRQVQGEHPARLSPRGGEFESIQFPERECLS